MNVEDKVFDGINVIPKDEYINVTYPEMKAQARFTRAQTTENNVQYVYETSLEQWEEDLLNGRMG